MATAFIQGMQGADPHYLKTVATAKHFAVHSGPEPVRNSFDAVVSEQDLTGSYLAAFHASVRDAGVASLMCAYNSVNGVPACASRDLLETRLRDSWGFGGYVVSDCGAIYDIAFGHHDAPGVTEAAALAVRAGTDLSCGTEFSLLVDAVNRGLLTEAEVDRAATRLFTARFRLGMFDPPERVPYATIPYSAVDSDTHRALALEAAEKSIVLLKNSGGVLPLIAHLQAHSGGWTIGGLAGYATGELRGHAVAHRHAALGNPAALRRHGRCAVCPGQHLLKLVAGAGSDGSAAGAGRRHRGVAGSVFPERRFLRLARYYSHRFARMLPVGRAGSGFHVGDSALPVFGAVDRFTACTLYGRVRARTGAHGVWGLRRELRRTHLSRRATARRRDLGARLAA